MEPFRAQRGSLHDTEPVLFVDDHKPQFVKRHWILDERMRSDDKVNRSTGKFCLKLATLACRRCTGQQPQPKS